MFLSDVYLSEISIVESDFVIIQFDRSLLFHFEFLLVRIGVICDEFESSGFMVTFQSVLKDLFDEMISPEDFTAGLVLAHPVCESGDVSRRLQNDFGGEHGTINLKHVFFQDEMTTPCVDDVGLQSTSRRLTR